jgi:mannose-1-phosphate guanylyltransferase/mannose-6-phosphate isomerase
MHVFILAGGSGSRLWPCSRTNFPKQFLRLFDDQSYLEKTVKRFLKIVPSNHLWIITNEKYLHEVRSLVGDLSNGLKEQIIMEPLQRNTTSAIGLGLSYLLAAGRLDPDEMVLVTPSDHLVQPDEVFLEAMISAEEFLQKEQKILLFGIRPSSPETGYGYIEVGEAIVGLKGCCRVSGFKEKPKVEQAQQYLSAGNYLWNSGIIAFTYRVFQQQIAFHIPYLASALEESHWDFLKSFPNFPNESIDYALLEKVEEILVMPLEITWSDIGTWDALASAIPSDEEGNILVGDVCAIETHHSLVMGSDRLICTLGIEDLIIVDTPDALLVSKRGQSQQIKQIVEKLGKANRPEILDHLKVQRPWGAFTRLEEGHRYQIKKLMVHPGAKLSLQMHYHRSEHWVVIQGTARVTIGEQVSLIHENEMAYVPKSEKHRLENPGKVPLLLIEIQVGEYLGEDDIVRFEDVYGRPIQEELVEEGSIKELERLTST